MTQPAVAQSIADVIGRVIAPAMAAVEALSGSSLTASNPAMVAAVDPSVLADSAMTRVAVTGPAGSGAITVVMPASGHDLDPAQAAVAMVSGAAQALGELTGSAFETGAPQPLGDLDGQDPEAAVVRFDITNPDESTFTVHWIVDASLGLSGPSPEPPPAPTNGSSEVAAAPLPELGGSIAHGAARDLHLLSDVPMDVTVELGKAVLQVRDLLSLREGSVVELDRSAGAAVDVLVNGTLIARGDVVVIDDDLGVRVTEIVER